MDEQMFNEIVKATKPALSDDADDFTKFCYMFNPTFNIGTIEYVVTDDLTYTLDINKNSTSILVSKKYKNEKEKMANYEITCCIDCLLLKSMLLCYNNYSALHSTVTNGTVRKKSPWA